MYPCIHVDYGQVCRLVDHQLYPVVQCLNPTILIYLFISIVQAQEG